MKESTLVFGALLLALSAVAYAALSTPPVAAVSTKAQSAPSVPFAAAACCTGAVETTADATAIRESYSDAGYWYYQP